MYQHGTTSALDLAVIPSAGFDVPADPGVSDGVCRPGCGDFPVICWQDFEVAVAPMLLSSHPPFRTLLQRVHWVKAVFAPISSDSCIRLMMALSSSCPDHPICFCRGGSVRAIIIINGIDLRVLSGVADAAEASLGH